MSHSKIISCLDIGTQKITTIIAQQAGDERLNIVAASSVPSFGFRKGQIINLEQASKTITQSIESAERMAGFQINHVYLSITAPYIESINSQGVVAISNPNGEIDQNDINRGIEAAKAISLPVGKEILHVIPRIFSVDGQDGIVDPIGMNGVRLEVEAHIILASSPSLKNLKKCLEDIGLTINGIVYSGLATAKAVLTDTEKELGVALIDIGGTNTTITIFFESSPVYSAVLPIGATNITNDLAIGLRFSLDEAEKIKTKLVKIYENKKFEDEIELSHFGIVADNRKISLQTALNGIVKPRLEEIFHLIYKQLNQSGYYQKIPAGIVLTGGGAQTINAKDICNKIINLPVRIAYPPQLGGLVDDIINPAYSSTIGTILYFLNDTQKKSDHHGKKIKFNTGNLFSKIKHLIQPLLP